MIETKLKPCPFCGGKPELGSYENSGNWIVVCSRCEAESRIYETEQEVVEAWNTRPTEDELNEEIKRLREALELIAKAKFYFARGEEEKQIRRVCEIAEEALKGKEE